MDVWRNDGSREGKSPFRARMSGSLSPIIVKQETKKVQLHGCTLPGQKLKSF
jgi:hypothetical protein